MHTSSPRVKDLDPPLAVMHHHDPSRLGTKCQTRGVDQGPPPAKGVVAAKGPGDVPVWNPILSNSATLVNFLKIFF
uniref:Uncharacterized protein n=1 Tax=Spermophilus dauricus TaxID=99837 RepID=A0A8C9QRU4_SPEDA